MLENTAPAAMAPQKPPVLLHLTIDDEVDGIVGKARPRHPLVHAIPDAIHTLHHAEGALAVSQPRKSHPHASSLTCRAQVFAPDARGQRLLERRMGNQRERDASAPIVCRRNGTLYVMVDAPAGRVRHLAHCDNR